MLKTSIFPGRYTQGPDALAKLGEELARYGKKGFAVCDKYALEEILPTHKESIAKATEVVYEQFQGECSDEEIARLVFAVKEKGADVLVGVGGGKALDTAKAVAYELKLPVIIVPTIASTDAPCSALSVIYEADGTFKRYLVLPKNPDLVLVDSAVVAQAPVRFLVAGMGDALSTWFEAESCRVKYAGNMTGNVGTMSAYALAELCYNTLLDYGVEAKISAEAGAVTPALERVIEANTLLSGLGFESGGLGACHAVHNGLTALEGTHAYYHGEKVAIGVLTELFLTDKEPGLMDEVYGFCEAVGLPTTLAEVGLENAGEEELRKVAQKACAQGETIYNELVPITAEAVLAALKAADAYGRKRKKA
ncbi:MAG TPA: glycerol dehydrogenase [Candidatus Moranbacteria bacterium]|nr:glycerol dehydrogenase [Candidatus Moranbacteria bacterium]